ncbi:MAG: M48 family metalloprotease [Brevundimonas sp.]|uniref:M48 family metalloprotease n=1 Tax=Brevundimonas sp. TaxID=1871086 RepID=UPI002728FDA7|nr:M48 family metalloprotease [Brevundimonas sp.]MDO9589205.1 M48 family metalloprotease [Brevundimonas sp.]MDP3369801.1 M48 family metalloprotease [Brevundimonas sp.]MDP3655573.1 M48 family metalloprotease [Brevundimonas sp.]MDZ4110673.1 M48 family metalloprotease [Brevundimonas sp.]
MLPPRLALFAVALAAASALFACSPAAVRPMSAGDDPSLRLTALTALDQRVARVAQRLSEDNADLCPAVRLSAGWTLHSASQYSRELQPHARSRFGLEGDLPGVLAAPPTSAAAAAGLREGDLIVSVGDVALDRGSARAAPAFEGLAANIAALDRALADGTTRLGVRRGEELLSVSVQPQRSCGYEVQLNPSDELNARADGRRLFISTALAGFAESDDELAVILGHELAHHVLRHRTWSDIGGAGRVANESAAVSGAGSQEQQADRVGLFLAARAGYDTRIAAAFWRRFGAANWRVRYPQLRHASAESRARALEAVQVEIDARRARGEPLLP